MTTDQDPRFIFNFSTSTSSRFHMKTCIIHATFLHLPLSSHSLPLYFFHNFVSQTFHIAMTITNQTNPPVPAATRPTRPKHSRNARSHHPLFPPGTKAQIIGLNAKPHYNGFVGTAGWYYPNKERIAITIQEDGCSHTLSIKLLVQPMHNQSCQTKSLHVHCPHSC